MKKPKTKRKITPKNIVKELEINDIWRSLLAGYGKESSEEGRLKFPETLSKYLQQELSKYKIYNDNIYNIIILFDNTKIIKVDSDKIYNAINSLQNKTKPLLLILVSGGGEPGSAYLIGKLCQEFSNQKLVIVVPRHAKSAATLLSCAANEIHMGSLSELGPIDPQINGMPTLGLKNSIEHIAELVSKNTESGEMFARYLQRTVEPVQIGYYERVAKSAVQYAEKLLNKHRDSLIKSPEEISEWLVYGYKDHGFVIDKEEAMSIFGPKIIKTNTPEYDIGNLIYGILAKTEQWADFLNHSFYFIGSINSSPNLWTKK